MATKRTSKQTNAATTGGPARPLPTVEMTGPNGRLIVNECERAQWESRGYEFVRKLPFPPEKRRAKRTSKPPKARPKASGRPIPAPRTVKHYPQCPFGAHAGRYFIEVLVTVDGDFEPLPLTGCTLEEPLSDDDKAILRAGGYWTDWLSTQPYAEYETLKRDLIDVYGKREEDLPGMTWAGVIATLKERGARHSEDYHSVRWSGETYTFTHQQAAIVALLWQAWENGTPDLGQDYLLENSRSAAGRVRDIFKQREGQHPAWGTMIVESPKRKGVYRL